MVVIDLGYRPRAWQAKVHALKARYQVLALHRRAGKTELALMRLIDAALRASPEAASHFAYIAPYHNQAVRIVWRRLKQRLHPLISSGFVEVSEASKSVLFPKSGAVLALYGGDNFDALRGTYLDGVVIDEVAQTPPELWEDVVYPQLQDRGGWAVFIGTPAGVDTFYRLFMEAPSKPGWAAQRYTVYDTGVFSREQIDDFANEMSSASFAREFLCDFEASGNSQLVSLADVEAAAARRVAAEDVRTFPRIIGVDPARFGDDHSAVIQRQGLMAFGLRVWSGLDSMQLAGVVAELIGSWQADAVFIDAGNGSGVIDRLRQLGFRQIVEVHFGGKPRASGLFANKRTEMWHDLADWLRSGGAIPNDLALKRDLAAPQYSFTPSGKRELERKEELKKRGLPSPDRGDALALTFAEPVHARNHHPLRPVGRAGTVFGDMTRSPASRWPFGDR